MGAMEGALKAYRDELAKKKFADVCLLLTLKYDDLIFKPTERPSVEIRVDHVPLPVIVRSVERAQGRYMLARRNMKDPSFVAKIDTADLPIVFSVPTGIAVGYTDDQISVPYVQIWSPT
jgi:hypothetical protein